MQKITSQTVAAKLTDYLHHKITLEELVEWAENVMMDGEFDERQASVLRDAVGRLGVADVKAFGLTWEDCEEILGKLGYAVRVDVSEAST